MQEREREREETINTPAPNTLPRSYRGRDIHTRAAWAPPLAFFYQISSFFFCVVAIFVAMGNKKGKRRREYWRGFYASAKELPSEEEGADEARWPIHLCCYYTGVDLCGGAIEPTALYKWWPNCCCGKKGKSIVHGLFFWGDNTWDVTSNWCRGDWRRSHRLSWRRASNTFLYSCAGKQQLRFRMKASRRSSRITTLKGGRAKQWESNAI